MSRNVNPPTTARKGSGWTSHLRQFSRTSAPEKATPLEPPRTPDTISSNSTVREQPPVVPKKPRGRQCTTFVNESPTAEEILLNLDQLDKDVKPGSLMAIAVLEPERQVGKAGGPSYLTPGLAGSSSTAAVATPEKRYLFTVKDLPKELKLKYSTAEIIVSKHLADAFGLRKGSQVFLEPVDASNPPIDASHVELSFREQYLSRADMWRLSVSELTERTVYKGQSIQFLGAIRAQVSAVYVEGRKVQSAFFGKNTRPVFRSESARYVLFIQMAREMWDFDAEGSGEIVFNKVVNGFLPALFKKWIALKVKHLVTIVLFARVEYDTGLATELANTTVHNHYYTGIQPSGTRRPYKDFYRVVVSEMASVEWTTILYQLKKEFNYFRRDISLHHQKAMATFMSASEDPAARGGIPTSRIRAESSAAMYGNVLEAINLASSQFAHDYIDRDLTRTGISVVVITPGAGVFEVEYDALRRITEALVGNGIGIDLVCIPKMPLHSVPLFRYRNPFFSHVPRHHVQPRPLLAQDSTPRQHTPLMGTSYASFTESFSPTKGGEAIRRVDSDTDMSAADEWHFALPQWLHVSYWTGSSEEAFSYQGLALSVADRSHNNLHDEFTIRCRMYDLQMRSILEMNEIEITPLYEDPVFQRILAQSVNRLRQRQVDIDNFPVVIINRTPDVLADHIYGVQKCGAQKLVKSGEDYPWKQLLEFDASRARLPKSRRGPDPGTLTGGEIALKRPLYDDINLLGTSIGEKRGSISTHSLSAAYSSSFSRSGSERRDMVTSLSSRLSPTKVPKVMRQISLGQRGFGIAAPKATVAEVRTENVNAANLPAPVIKSAVVPRPPSIRGQRPISPQTISSIGSSGLTGQDKSETLDAAKGTPAMPIVIKSSLQPPEPFAQLRPASILPPQLARSFRPNEEVKPVSFSSVLKAEDAQKLYVAKLLAGDNEDLPTKLSPMTALSPWLTILNPSNPETSKVDVTLYSRWQHVFTRPSEMSVMKWKSLCSPAAVPLTTEYFPTKAQIDTEFERKPYTVSQNQDDEVREEPKSREEFIRELVSLRFSQGFQAVIGPGIAEAFGQKSPKTVDLYSKDSLAEDGTSIFMSIGNTIHQLSSISDSDIEVTIFVRKPIEPLLQFEQAAPLYKPAIRTLLDSTYESREIDIITPRPERNWNYIDSYVAGHNEEMTENLRFWRARFVLIPMEPRHPSLPKPVNTDNSEEVRLEGIKKLAQHWLKNRYVPPSDRGFEPTGTRRRKILEPLDIVFKTDDPSAIIAAELETLPLLEGLDGMSRKNQLVTSRDRFKKSNLSIAALAEAIQQPVENGGVRMQNRRWHLRLHSNCFIGSDMTTWLYENFDDIEDRAEAETLGQSLMLSDEDKSRDGNKRGIFVHVEKRHPFRDGQYFYQIVGEYAKPHPGWFSSRRIPPSGPTTPGGPGTTERENGLRDTPRTGLSRPVSIHEEMPSLPGAPAPTPHPGFGKRPKVMLSKVMKYDVDPRKRSYRPERINLHYDRLHNPDNCYHIRIDWMNVTARLIEDAIKGWSNTAAQHEMRLVEVPIAEACTIGDVNPFRQPYLIKLAVPPPMQQPTVPFEPTAFAAKPSLRRHFYQKEILKKFDFVLDIEAASNFPANVDVTYSWGKPDFKYSQYIHRSGLVLAEITDDGDFLLLANRLYHNRTVPIQPLSASREQQQPPPPQRNPGPLDTAVARMMVSQTSSPSLKASTVRGGDISSLSSPAVRPSAAEFPGGGGAPGLGPFGSLAIGTGRPSLVTEPEAIKDELEAFCLDGPALDAFFKESLDQGNRQTLSAVTPAMGPLATLHQEPLSVADLNIPVLGLPPGLLATDGDVSPSPSPRSGGGAPGGGPGGGGAGGLGRRSSVQYEGPAPGQSSR